MSIIKVRGGRPLYGKMYVSGAKNSALPMMAASLLSEEWVTLYNVPAITDVSDMLALLEFLGSDAVTEKSGESRVLKLRARCLSAEASIGVEFTGKLRASILVLGPLVTRCGYVKMRAPGGCAIGVRPIDFHIKALKAMGAKIEIVDGFLIAAAENGLRGAEICFDNVSVGATENIILAASLASGVTVLRNIATEPEVMELINLLKGMGAEIDLCNHNTCIVRGKSHLRGYSSVVASDRIEAGTYAMAVAATGGEVELHNMNNCCYDAWTKALVCMGVGVRYADNRMIISADKANLEPICITTRPYPYFPSDLQAQLATLALSARGISIITETIYENRFMYVNELCNMGAQIKIVANKVIVIGANTLRGTRIKATDLRAAGALVIAALSAEGESFIENAHHIDRGYQNIETKLLACGAEISRVDS